MLIEYAWVNRTEQPPAKGTRVRVSGDPDKAVLKGEVARSRVESGTVVLLIAMPDRQVGAVEFQEWVTKHGDVGVEVVGSREGKSVLER